MNRDYIVALAISGVTRLLSGATARWLDCEPSEKQRIYFANHSSHLDAVVLWSALPPPVRRLVRPVAAKDYWDSSPLRRYLANNVFNAVLIARPGKASPDTKAPGMRGAAAAIESMIEAMGSTHSLIIFPEGTRGTGEKINSFKSGLYHLAKRKPEAELVPVYMENLSRILPKGDFLPVPLLSSISLGKPIKLEAGENKAEFLERARNAVEVMRAT